MWIKCICEWPNVMSALGSPGFDKDLYKYRPFTINQWQT